MQGAGGGHSSGQGEGTRGDRTGRRNGNQAEKKKKQEVRHGADRKVRSTGKLINLTWTPSGRAGRRI